MDLIFRNLEERIMIPLPDTKNAFWVNPKNGFEWHIDKYLTDYCKRDFNNNPKLNATVFQVVDRKAESNIGYVLIDNKTKEPIADGGIESISVKIDALRFGKKTNK